MHGSGGGWRLGKCLGHPIPWGKNSGSVHDMYIVRACISCTTTVPVQEQDRQLQLKTRKTTKQVSEQRCSVEWGCH